MELNEVLGEVKTLENLFSKSATESVGNSEQQIVFHSHYASGIKDFLNANFASAAKSFEQVLDIQSGQVLPSILLGQCYLNLKEFDKGIEVLKQLQKRGSYPLFVDHFLSQLFMEKGDKNMAIESLEKIRCSDSSNQFTFYKLSNLYFQTGRLNEAIKTCRDGLKHYPDSDAIRTLLSYLSEAIEP